jgi:hypothetical protein
MKIAVSANSLHYRYWKWLQDPLRFMDRWDAPTAKQLEARAKEPTAICGYFWAIILSPVHLAGIVLVAALLACLAVVLAIVVGPFWLAYKGIKRARQTEPVKETVGVVAAYAKARKARVCPLIEVHHSPPS